MVNLRDYGLVSNNDDGFINLIFDTYWIATLSDGQKVLQDDNRPGAAHHSAWVRLGNMIRHTELSIVKLGVYFRGNNTMLPENMGGYYYSKGTLQGCGRSAGLHYHVMGWLTQPDTVECVWIKTPELVKINRFTRPLVECKTPMMILNPVG